MYIAPEYLRAEGRQSTTPMPTVFEIIDAVNKTIQRVSNGTRLSTSQVQPGAKVRIGGRDRDVVEYNYGNSLLTVYVRV